MSWSLFLVQTMEKRQLADGNPLQFLEDLSSLDFNELAQQIYSLLQWFADTVSSLSNRED